MLARTLQLSELQAVIQQRLAALDSRRVALLEEKLAITSRVTAALGSHMDDLLVPLNAQRCVRAWIHVYMHPCVLCP